MPVYRLTDQLIFPPVEMAEEGLLAFGGDLSPERLLLAYRSGIFPWYSHEEPILWWSPDPRFVLRPEEVRVTKSMKQLLNNDRFACTLDTAFDSVVTECAAQYRPGQPGTWITPEMAASYGELHRQGYAHSVEVWQEGALVGGLYGVSLGGMFFGESMFHKVSNASKFGFILLARSLQERGFLCIDCQIETAHLASLGAKPINRSDFLQKLSTALEYPTLKGRWTDWWQ